MTEHHYIYLQQEREFFNKKENVYKLGKTTQTIDKRFGGYPKGTLVITVINVISSDDSERVLLRLFRNNFENRKDIGIEYFQGEIIEMVKILQQHQLEQLKPEDDVKHVIEPVLRYNNTVVEFLDKRTLPVMAKDERKPLFINPKSVEIFEIYKQWCKETGKKSVTKKFFDIWWGKRKDTSIFGRGILIYSDDPEEELASCDIMQWSTNNWLWYFTSFPEQIMKDRPVLSHKIDIADLPKLPGGISDISFCSQALKYYPRKGNVIQCIIYSEPLTDNCLIDVSPWSLPQKPSGWENCWGCSTKFSYFNSVGLFIQKSWLDVPTGPGTLWSDSDGSILVCQCWDELKRGQRKFLREKFTGCYKIISQLEKFNEIKNRLYNDFWSGSILFPFEEPLKTVTGQFLIGFGLKSSWENIISFVWSNKKPGSLLKLNQLEWTYDQVYELDLNFTPEEISQNIEHILVNLMKYNDWFCTNIWGDYDFYSKQITWRITYYFDLLTAEISYDNHDLLEAEWDHLRSFWPEYYNQQITKYKEIIDDKKISEIEERVALQKRLGIKN